MAIVRWGKRMMFVVCSAGEDRRLTMPLTNQAMAIIILRHENFLQKYATYRQCPTRIGHAVLRLRYFNRKSDESARLT
jgi:hypothetical protein